MRAVLVEAPEWLLEERRSLGLDRFDEMWEGVLHVVPAPGGPHQRFGTCLVQALGPAAVRRGLLLSYETALFAAVDDYRVPDLAVYRPEHASERGIDGTAELIIELRSSRDESYDKLDWYAARGVTETLIADPRTRAVERYALRGGAYRLVEPDPDGMVTSDALAMRLGPVDTTDGPRLRIHDGEITTDC